METNKKLLIVTSPVANLRSKPVDAKHVYIHDDLQETQVLYNETLLYLDEIDCWYYVEAIEQKKYAAGNVIQGYPGWIRKSNVAIVDMPAKYNTVVKTKTASIFKSRLENAGIYMTVSIGTRFEVKETTNKEYYTVALANNKRGYISKEVLIAIEGTSDVAMLRKAIVNTGRLFLDTPYLWGGRSIIIADKSDKCKNSEGKARDITGKSQKVESLIFNTRSPMQYSVNTGVDCSGLTNLVYRANNIDIPRDAREQWIAANKITYNNLKSGDLIFISTEDKPDSINHVMLYIGSEEFIEAAETGNTVTINTFTKRFGQCFNQLIENKFLINNRLISFGSFIPEQ